MLTKLRNQLRFILRRNKSEHDLDREIRFHLEMEAQDIEGSSSADDARRVALANFGSVAACKEAVRETWGLRIWSDLQRDFQYTFRMVPPETWFRHHRHSHVGPRHRSEHSCVQRFRPRHSAAAAVRQSGTACPFVGDTLERRVRSDGGILSKLSGLDRPQSLVRGTCRL